MNSLQTPTDGQSTSNPQSISQPSLTAPTNNLQGSVDLQDSLLKLPAGGLKVSGCETTCEIPANAQVVPAKSSNHFGIAVTVILIVVLILLIWRFAAVIKRVSSGRQSKVETLPDNPLPEDVKVALSSETSKKIVPKTKKTKRRKSNRKLKR